MPSAIDRVLGTRSREERTRLLQRFRSEELLICTIGLCALVKVQGRTRWGRPPHECAYVFALPDVAYVARAADRFREKQSAPYAPRHDSGTAGLDA